MYFWPSPQTPLPQGEGLTIALKSSNCGKLSFLLTFFGHDASYPYTNGYFSSGQALNPLSRQLVPRWEKGLHQSKVFSQRISFNVVAHRRCAATMTKDFQELTQSSVFSFGHVVSLQNDDNIHGYVVQLDRTSLYESEGRRFKSCRVLLMRVARYGLPDNLSSILRL